MFKENPTLGILGLGFVGLPLALAFGQHFKTIGFDISSQRIAELQNKHDRNQQASQPDFLKARLLQVTSCPQDLNGVDVFIIAVPTPVDLHNQPDLNMLKNASLLAGSHLQQQGIVIYESTTYPTCTQEFCVPLLEQASHLRYNRDFFVGYSPERINVGDARPLSQIVKITSGSTPESARYIDQLYQRVICQTHLVSSIEVAESAKILENTQRDLNIAFINDMAMLLDRLGVNLYEVLEACQTKWNFMPFIPGLVGGHCISIDPYYLSFLARRVQHDPSLIEASRQINNAMPTFLANKIAKLLHTHQLPIQNARVLILGASFKENCNDLRNSQSLVLQQELEGLGCRVDIYDPLIGFEDMQALFASTALQTLPQEPTYHAVILVVAHRCFANLDLSGLLLDQGFIYDLKAFLKCAPHLTIYTP
ncbi:nucleotide sugar dehydrogenase [Helicobacter bizzozeronii]|uniref:nucleotide sugar dehydrogenase n=1 Tax=Helicobacter bizzozeronii TaxID=56877 RepID=UPI000CF164D6|nr:nucleotide sugar dehydrogenase [Helicobacter bizzozeronii]